MAGDGVGQAEKPSVFIVEDEEALREVYEGYLPMNGFQVVGAAGDGEDAVTQLGALERRPDVVLMDHRMPKKSGLEASKELVARDPELAILFVTADMGVEQEARDAGARMVLVKPFPMEALASALRKVAGARG